MDTKDVDINIASVPDWNRLSIDKTSPGFDNKFRKVIIYYDVLHADEWQSK